MEPTVCEKCGQVINPGAFPFCPHGQKSEVAFGVKGDEYPGGIWIENLGPKPVKVYSETERRMIMKKRGLVEFVRHTGVPGSDKSPHTTNWDVGRPGDSRPFCMLSQEEQIERRREAAERFGLSVDELDRLGDGQSLVVLAPGDETGYVEDDSGPRDGGDFARAVVRPFNVAADGPETRELLKIIRGE